MEKKRLFKILAKAENAKVSCLAKKIKDKYSVTIVKKPEKTLAMIKMREPVMESLFYLGEVIICEAVVMLDGVKGMAVTMGDDFDKVTDMAIIDAACNKGVFEDYATLEQLEQKQILAEQRENAMFMKTKVNFHSMDAEDVK